MPYYPDAITPILDPDIELIRNWDVAIPAEYI